MNITMKSAKEIVPWKCHICHSEFDILRGGICSSCNRATCRKHLKEIGKKIKHETNWICADCISSDEKSKNNDAKISNENAREGR
jgi:hypothetical protein